MSRSRSALKLLAGFSAPLVVTTLLIAGTFIATLSLARQAREVRERNYALAHNAQLMSFDVVQVQQWLTDVSATRGLNGMDDGPQKAAKYAAAFRETAAKSRAIMKAAHETSGEQRLSEVERAFEPYYEQGKTMSAAYVSGGPAAGNPIMDHFDTAAEALHAQLEPMVKDQTALLETSLDRLP